MTEVVVQTPFTSEVRQLAGAFLSGYANANTRNMYRLHLKRWLAFCAERQVDPIRLVRRAHVDVYLRMEEGRGLAPATLAARYHVVSAFYKWLVGEEYIDADPTARVKCPKVPVQQGQTFLTRTELADWLDAAKKMPSTDYALACLLGINALRVSEATGARIEGLGMVDYHHTLAIVGKGNKPAIVPLPPRTAQAVHTCIGNRTTGLVLLSRWGTPMMRNAVARIVENITSKAGIDKCITPHSLRRSAITAALNSGVSLRDTQHYARHADPRTTMRYDKSGHTLDRHASYAVMQYIGGAV